jgi:hypothetical protein
VIAESVANVSLACRLTLLPVTSRAAARISVSVTLFP